MVLTRAGEVLAQDPVSGKDRNYSMQDFLALYDRLVVHQVRARGAMCWQGLGGTGKPAPCLGSKAARPCEAAQCKAGPCSMG